MPDYTYTFLAVDLVSGDVLDAVLPAKGTWERKANEPGTATLTFHIGQVARSLVDPMLTGIYIIREGQVVWAGITVRTVADAGSRTVQVGYVEMHRYLWRRRVRTDLAWTTPTLQVDIAAALVSVAEPDGIGLVPVIVGANTVGRVRTYPGADMKPAGQLLEDLAGVVAGLDFELRVRADGAGGWIREVLLADTLSTDLSWVWQAGVDLGAYKVTTDGARMANRVDATGDPSGPGPVPVATAQVPLGQYPRLDDATAYRSVTDQTTLAEHAEGDVLAVAVPLDTPDLQLAVPDLPGAVGTVSPGDTFTVLIDDGAAAYNDRARILGMKWTWQVGAPTRIEFTLATVPTATGRVRAGGPVAAGFPVPRDPNLADQVDTLQRRIELLERTAT